MRILRVLCLVLSLYLAMPTAAETPGNNMHVTITGEITDYNAFGEPTRSILSNWVSSSSLSLLFGNDSSQASLTVSGEEILKLYQAKDIIGVHPGDTLYTGNGKTAEQLLGAEPTWLGSVRQAAPMARAALLVLRKLPTLLDPYEKVAKDSISIKNVGRATHKLTYELTGEQWQRLWPDLIALCEDAMRSENVGEKYQAQTLSFLRKVRFDEAVTFKRFTDKEKRDMGWQLTGKLSLGDEDARKITLFGGYRENSGVYLSLKLPAVRGSNNLQLVLSGSYKDDDLLLDGAFSRTQNKKTISAYLQVSVNTADGANGRVILSARDDEGKKSALTLSPKLTQEENLLHGPMSLKWTQGSKTLDMMLSVALSPAAKPKTPHFARTVDLDQLDAVGLAQEKEILNRALSGMMLSIVNRVPLEAQSVLIHDIGRSERTQGASVPVLPFDEAKDINYLVMEEEDSL